MNGFHLNSILLVLFISTPLLWALECGPGLYSGTNEAGNELCLSCPQDTYKEATNENTECISCPANAPRNHKTGSSDPAECIYAECGQGQQYDPTDFLLCVNCTIGQYQDKTYPLSFDVCENCPAGTSTQFELSISSDCVASCPDGEEYSAVAAACVECEVNYYKDNGAETRGEYSACVQCPDAGFRTESTGATSVGE